VQDGPYSNLKAVVQQTGVRPDTLRAWERRYGLPSPNRSGGKHRLYSQHDISIIHWLLARQREGLSISRAVELWQRIEEEGRDPLQSPVPTAPLSAPKVTLVAAGGAIARLRQEWLDACLAYDEQAAEQVITLAFALYPPETVCLELMQKAIAEIGERWYAGQTTVQQEHFASALAIRRLDSLIMAAPVPIHPGRILAACPPDENHIFSLLLLTFLLRRQGWAVTYLGASVPVEQLESTLAMTRPQLVILAAQQLHTAATLWDVAQVLHREQVPLAYGGLIFKLLPTLRSRIAGHFLGERLDGVPQVVEMLMTMPHPYPRVEAIPEAYRLARDHYHDRIGLVEADLLGGASTLAIAPARLDLANRQLGMNIDAALALGDIDNLSADLEWVEGLISNHRLPAEALRSYLCAYHEATKRHLDERGELVVRWLDHLVGQSGC